MRRMSVRGVEGLPLFDGLGRNCGGVLLLLLLLLLHMAGPPLV